MNWNTTALANGSYTLAAKARDAAGNQTTSTAITVTVNNTTPTDTTPPTVSMTAPAGGTTVSGTVALSANASDNVGVAGVQFLVNGTSTGAEDTSFSLFGHLGYHSCRQWFVYSRRTSSRCRRQPNHEYSYHGQRSAIRRHRQSPGLVSAYSFNEGTGTVVTDVSGNSNNGTIGTATWSTSGRYGSALSFNGSTSRVDIPDSASLDLTTGMTIEAWVRPTTLSNWRTVLMKEQRYGSGLWPLCQ